MLVRVGVPKSCSGLIMCGKCTNPNISVSLVIMFYRSYGEIALSPELAEYKLFAPADVRCWRAGTGFALADWLRSRGHEPRFIEWPPRT